MGASLMKTIQVQDGLVLICGPSASGKTSLARKMYNEAPYADKTLVSHDAMLRNFLKEAGIESNVFYTGLTGDLDKQFKMSVLRAICDGLQSRRFVIYESVYCDPNRLTPLIASFPLMGLDRPLTLIKMWLPLSLQMEFVQTHAKRKAFRPDVLLSQRSGFQSVVEPRHFANQAEWIREYTVNDPRELKLEFYPVREMTKELLAAYEAHEELTEEVGDLVEPMSDI